ncbi:ScbA/BarX family gamma-butyrolactone biosynthesis protein [Streptomyces sp. NPDC007088]|uniref:ScbA/BarX family gamma-butyrolactone biosynthesis protein n=1 Tax=Streptomyces sp. NPDC007088 TaxID=3364773 RepID=UPI0036C747A6
MPVTNEQVHKDAADERLLTTWHQDGDAEYVIGARWPRDHTFYASQHNLFDPLLLAESVRQCVPLLSHVAYAVPFGHRQSWSHFSYSLEPEALETGAAMATDIELRVACRDVVHRMGRLASMNMEVEVVREGLRIGSAQTRFVNHAPAPYNRLRGPYADLASAVERALPTPPPSPPARVGRTTPADVVLSPTNSARRSQLRVDLGHPVLFDHPVDHAPGMLLLEAVRQAAQAAVRPAAVCAVAMDVVFARYTELDAPCWIHTDLLPADRADSHRLLVTAVQRDVCVFSAITTLRPLR